MNHDTKWAYTSDTDWVRRKQKDLRGEKSKGWEWKDKNKKILTKQMKTTKSYELGQS